MDDINYDWNLFSNKNRKQIDCKELKNKKNLLPTSAIANAG